MDVNIEEEDSNREMRSSPSHPDVIQEPIFNDKYAWTSKLMIHSALIVVSFSENVVNVDVSREQPNPETSLHNVDELPESLRNVEGPVLPQTLCK